MKRYEMIKKMTVREVRQFFNKLGPTNCNMCIYRDRNEGCTGIHTTLCCNEHKLWIRNEAKNLKEMTVDEIVNFLINGSPCKTCVFDPSGFCGEKNCRYGIKAWLESECE